MNMLANSLQGFDFEDGDFDDDDPSLQQYIDRTYDLYEPITTPASPRSINSLMKIKLDKLPEIDQNCAVCKYTFDIGEELLKLPCQHLYHPECILPWLKNNNTCPVCRTVLMTRNSNSQPTSQSSAKIQENRTLIDEQDRKYDDSLQQDREKERKKREKK